SQAIEALLAAESEANVYPEQARTFLSKVIDEFDALQPHLQQVARERGEALLAAHRRVRAAAQVRGVRYRVEPQLPLDVLGIYIYLPVGQRGMIMKPPPVTAPTPPARGCPYYTTK